MGDNYDRFGTPDENIQAASRWAEKFRKKHKYHIQVPNRKEVATLPFAELKALLVGWMEHSPIETIPSRTQIALVRDVLLERPDSTELKTLLEMCKYYIEGQ